MVGIIDYGMGNLKSVYNAIDYIGFDAKIIKEKDDFEECTHFIIPGVGTYEKAMNSLKEKGFIEIIESKIDEGIPLLGICLGMQILSTIGTELSKCSGLNFIPGSVNKFKIDLSLPHVGWNNINIVKDHPLLEDVSQNVDFYFVHSYHYSTKEEHILALTDYGIEYPSIIGKDNIVGIQFHPEKSQENGLTILKNFCFWDGTC